MWLLEAQESEHFKKRGVSGASVTQKRKCTSVKAITGHPGRVLFRGIVGKKAMLHWTEVAVIIVCHCLGSILGFRN